MVLRYGVKASHAIELEMKQSAGTRPYVVVAARAVERRDERHTTIGLERHDAFLPSRPPSYLANQRRLMHMQFFRCNPMQHVMTTSFSMLAPEIECPSVESSHMTSDVAFFLPTTSFMRAHTSTVRSADESRHLLITFLFLSIGIRLQHHAVTCCSWISLTFGRVMMP